MNKEQLKQKSNNTFVDNDEGLIDPAEHRAFNDALVDSVLFKDDTSDIAAKATPADADGLLVTDSANGNKVKKTTWANIKAALLAHFTTTFAKLAHTHTLTSLGAAKKMSPWITMSRDNVFPVNYLGNRIEYGVNEKEKRINMKYRYNDERLEFIGCLRYRANTDAAGEFDGIAIMPYTADLAPFLTNMDNMAYYITYYNSASVHPYLYHYDIYFDVKAINGYLVLMVGGGMSEFSFNGNKLSLCSAQ